ncbi:flagellar basal body L-ring protein FlgH [Marispirochaeta sp.]|uniref:flagellar basal body L-ring protein FlgH n=1 Tax=Marispirochaeta sp. TaxID=2038653 RepID=UPI0029C7A1C3|nr:flagellar basal body L-ring protein FlgH [Marispirochaeta sp.]
MKQLTALLSALILFSTYSGADSLVPPDFPGYLTAAGSLQVGDLVGVAITSETSMQYTSSFSSTGSVSLTFTGGEGDGLFNFLPSSDSMNQISADGEEETTFSTRIGARIVQTGPAGSFFLQGSRETRIDRAVQRVEIEGWANLRDLNDEGRIAFDDLADSVLVYSSFSRGDGQVIGNEDLVRQKEAAEQTEQDVPPVPEEEFLPEALAEIPEETLPEEPASMSAAYSFSNDARRRLLLEYINQMINLLFSPSE